MEDEQRTMKNFLPQASISLNKWVGRHSFYLRYRGLPKGKNVFNRLSFNLNTRGDYLFQK